MDKRFDVRKRKKQLIRLNIEANEKAMAGKRIAAISVAAMFLARLALMIFEIIYCAVRGYDAAVWPHLLFLPFMIAAYMIFDGNKPLSSVLMIAAALRIVYHFAVVFPGLGVNGMNALSAVTVLIYLAQFLVFLFLNSSPKCELYFSIMQKINLKIRSEMIGRR